MRPYWVFRISGSANIKTNFLCKDFEYIILKQNEINILPLGIINKLNFVILWLTITYSEKYSNLPHEMVAIYHNGEIVHHSFLFGPSPKYPFMSNNDYQIGLIYTKREHRNKGLAFYACSEIIKKYSKENTVLWYLTTPNNRPSINLSSKLGFEYYGNADRISKLGIGHYSIERSTQKSYTFSTGDIGYSQVTESPGLMATNEQIKRLYQRYWLAKEFTKDKDVLEVAFGSGMGLGYLANVTKSLTGIDIDIANVNYAKQYYSEENKRNTSIKIELMDAHNLNYPDKSFDVVIGFEVLYYLHKPSQFFSEVKRVLRTNGIFILSTVNVDWEAFHPSPLTYQYFSVPELFVLLKSHFSEVKFYGSFKTEATHKIDRLISFIKKASVSLSLIPDSLAKRNFLKRIFLGKLSPLPKEVYDGMATVDAPEEISHDRSCYTFKIIYAIAGK